MACLKKKIQLGIVLNGAVVAVGGGALATTTGGFVLGMLASAGAGAAIALALDDLAECLEQNGQPEMARTMRETAQKIRDELDRLWQLATQMGVPVP